MSEKIKLDFRLVPTKGIASGQGYRAEFVRKDNRVIGIDDVIAEAQQNGAFWNMPPSLVKSNLETFFGTMIRGVLADGKTRKLDGYFELSLKIHGKFEKQTDDFDPAIHSLDLSVKPLSAFAAKPTEIKPVNVNRIKQFRLSYITAADGLHENHQVVYGKEFIIRGSNLTPPEGGLEYVPCQVETDKHVYHCAQAPILAQSDSEIRCAWPSDYGPETLRKCMWVSVSKIVRPIGSEPDIDRTIHAGIYPE